MNWFCLWRHSVDCFSVVSVFGDILIVFLIGLSLFCCADFVSHVGQSERVGGLNVFPVSIVSVGHQGSSEVIVMWQWCQRYGTRYGAWFVFCSLHGLVHGMFLGPRDEVDDIEHRDSD